MSTGLAFVADTAFAVGLSAPASPRARLCSTPAARRLCRGRRHRPAPGGDRRRRRPPRLESHLDRCDVRGAEVLVLPLPSRWEGAVRGRTADPDAVARAAERDPLEAASLLLDRLTPLTSGFGDWPDALASALQADPSLTLAEWADAAGRISAAEPRVRPGVRRHPGRLPPGSACASRGGGDHRGHNYTGGHRPRLRFRRPGAHDPRDCAADGPDAVQPAPRLRERGLLARDLQPPGGAGEANQVS